jgi:hypothetical protein
MPMLHIRADKDNYSYVQALANLNGISQSSAANMLLTHCRRSRLGVGMTPDASADARSDAPEETPDDDH